MWGPICEWAQHIGARAGNRTLNLGIKSLSTLRLREAQGGSGSLIRIRIFDAAVSGSLLEYQGVSRSRCQIRCEVRGPRGLHGFVSGVPPRAKACLPRQFGMHDAATARGYIVNRHPLVQCREQSVGSDLVV
jgi:hypothetical protein